jgi:4-hydroxy-tetrahydrodipicolinate reductase
VTIPVVLWGTGGVGVWGVRGIVNHPDLDLAGVYVHSAEKAGRDVGELAGIDPIGIAATNDLTDVLGLGAECLAYFAAGPGREPEIVKELSAFLEQGCNVVTTSLNSFIYPPGAPEDQRRPLEAACEHGSASLFATGVEPGVCSDVLPLALLTMSDEIRSIRIQEIADYRTYPVEHIIREVIGFGKPIDHVAPLFQGAMLAEWWGGTVLGIADAMGLALDDIRTVHEVASIDRDIDTPVGPMGAGTITCVRFEVQGIVDGEPIVVLEHVNRMHPDSGSQWTYCAMPCDVGYRVIIEGFPNITCELKFAGGDDGMAATAMRAVNAIPAVCSARSGLLTPHDLPYTVGRHVVA